MRCRSSLLLAMLAGLGFGTAQAQTRIVTGRVIDSLTKEPITTGQVAVQGTQVGTTIKDDGTFTIAAPTRDVTLMVRSIGFKRKDVALPANQNSAQVALERDYFQLEAIIVTGQATGVERKNLANAVASVTAEQLVKAPTATVEQSLQGKLAGANITQNTFAPGGGVLVRLRGVTSINGNFTPLYVVDGVIVSDAAIMPGNNFITQSTPGVQLAANTDGPVNRIADLNPSDIESVEVLKGASASAIYGSKASNGVIMITTKRGRVGAPQFRLTQRTGISHMSHQIGSRTFTSAAEAQSNFGGTAGADFTAANGALFDHEKEIAGGSPVSSETSLDVQGGTETSRYFASGLVKHDGGIVHGTYYDKQTLRLNLDQDVGRKLTFTIQAGATHSISDRGLVNNENNGSSYWSAFSITPSFYDLRATCPDGSRQSFCKGGIYASNKYGSSNPLQTASEFENREHVWRFMGTGKINYNAITSAKHTLKLLANGGVDYFNQRNAIFSPPDLQFEAIDGLLGTAAASISDNVNSNINTNLVYTYKSGGTSATTQVGLAYETRSLDVNRTLGANLVGGLRIPQAGTTIYVESRKEKTRDLGFFAQEEFLTLGEKLLLTVGARADQSSDNGDPNKLFFYPKASASYRWNVKKSFLDDLKIRAAFGQSGNQPIYGTKFSELAPVNIGGIAGSRLALITASDSLKPERQREIEGGIDATLFKGRASLEATVYQKEISDLILRRGLATSTGFTTQIFNGGSLRNRGIELSLNLVPVQSRSIQWNARTNFALNRCIITSLPVPTFRAGGVVFGTVQTEVGQSCTQIVGNDTLGRLPGDAALGAIGSVVVRKVRDGAADFNLGFSNDITVKALRLYFLFDYQKGGALTNITNILYDFPGNSPDQKVARKPGANGPAGVTGDFRAANFAREALLVVEDQSYLKLREVSLSLELPAATVHRFWSGARFVRFTVTGRNLLNFFPYIGMDPEGTQTPASLARSRAADIWPYPPSRSVWFAIDLGF